MAAHTDDESPQVLALFREEVAAREAVGLLEHHGFRPEAIRVVRAADQEWELLAPPRRRRRRHGAGDQAVVAPMAGSVVIVRTLRVDDARLVLSRADGEPVRPVRTPAPEGLDVPLQG